MSERVHIACIAKNEGRYLREWCLFHQIVGVEHVTIYDNASSDNTLKVLAPFVDSDFVDVVSWPHPAPNQLEAYQHYINYHQGEKIWTALIDCDEFLFPVEHNTTPEALATICEARSHARSAIGVNWTVFGSGGRPTYSPEPVIERFVWRPYTSNPINQHIKSIVWMDQKVSAGRDPHLFDVAGGTFNETGEKISSPLVPYTSNILRLNHYATKSDEELAIKLARGRADTGEIRKWEEFDGYQAKEVLDINIQRFLPELRRRLAE